MLPPQEGWCWPCRTCRRYSTWWCSGHCSSALVKWCTSQSWPWKSAQQNPVFWFSQRRGICISLQVIAVSCLWFGLHFQNCKPSDLMESTKVQVCYSQKPPRTLAPSGSQVTIYNIGSVWFLKAWDQILEQIQWTITEQQLMMMMIKRTLFQTEHELV